jgi:hypothetical protein
MLSPVEDELPQDDEVLGDHPEPAVEISTQVKAKVIKTTSKGVLVK